MARLLMLALVACGGSSGPAATASGPPAAMIASAATPDDAIVATVNGRPVWGSCVATQAARDPKLTRAQALDQCISFELLAQEAEARDLATFREVVDETRTALVSRLVDQFAATNDASHLSAQIDDVYRTRGDALNRPELRGSTHALIKVDDKAPDALEERAKQLAEQLYAKLANETGLFAHHLEDAAKTLQIDKPLELVVEKLPVFPLEYQGFAAEYRGALFAIPEVGRVSSVTRTSYGYHVILFTELIPAETMGRDLVFGQLQRQQFVRYVAELMKGVNAETYPEKLADEDTP